MTTGSAPYTRSRPDALGGFSGPSARLQPAQYTGRRQPDLFKASDPARYIVALSATASLARRNLGAVTPVPPPPFSRPHVDDLGHGLRSLSRLLSTSVTRKTDFDRGEVECRTEILTEKSCQMFS
jgi:hypothetical protein